MLYALKTTMQFLVLVDRLADVFALEEFSKNRIE